MSAIDVDGPVPASVAQVRGGARGNASSAPDGGAFGAMMADLNTASGGAPARKVPQEEAPAREGEETAAGKNAKPQGQGLDDLLSQVLAGAQDEAKPTAGNADALRAAKARATREAAEKAALADAAANASGKAATSAPAEAEDLTQAHGTPQGRPKLRTTPEQGETKLQQPPSDAASADTLAMLRTAAVQAAEAERAQTDAEAGQGTAGAAVAETQGDTDEAPVDVPTMRVKVLSRETHFAPVRSFALAPEGGASSRTGKDGLGEGEDGKTSRADAFTASPRERAAMRLDQARQQDQATTNGELAPQPAAGRKTDSTEEMIAGPDASGGSASGLPGSLPLNSLKQVSSAIGAEVARLVDPSFVSDAEPGSPLRTNGPLRIIAIQLQPLELGTVTVRMRLSDDGLDVRISASNPATARMLQQDQARLTDMLKAQGIEAATVTVTNPSDQAAAWTRFEIAPKGASTGFSGQGDGERSSGQQPGQQNSGNGSDEGENASGGRRSGRNRG